MGPSVKPAVTIQLNAFIPRAPARTQTRPCRRQSFRTSRSGLLVIREIDENDAGPTCLTDMRDSVGDSGWRVPFGDLEQGSALLREPPCERYIGSPLLQWLLHPTVEHHAFEREGPGRK